MSQLADILVSLTLETSEFTNKLKETAEEIEKFRQETARATGSLQRNFRSNFNSMRNTMNDFQRTSSNASSNINRNFEEMSDSFERINGSGADTRTDLNRNFDEMSDSMDRIGRDSDRMSRRFGDSMDGFNEGFGRGYRGMRRFRNGMGSMQRFSENAFDDLPDYLRPFQEELSNTQDRLSAPKPESLS